LCAVVVSPLALESALFQRSVMALGFGFNKAKVLASAEKFVQQGKLSNAIAEYEKIIKEDPKDLTVLNTVGDLCARVGQNEQAAQYFKRVGDHYAQDGFTVKAIAIYKKLTKLSPGNFETIQKLAELYSQQGLFSDAKAQYMQVADQLLKSGDNAQAARVFQRILELDPENTTSQSKLADLYLKLGKKAEACKIYYTAAESLYARASFDAADGALGKVLALDPGNGSALMLRGMIAADAGDSASAIQHLEQVPDLDSRPDGLRVLLRAKLQSGAVDGAEGVASKLVTVHNDLGGVSALAQWYVANQQIASALKLYDSYSDRFMASDKAGFEEAVYPLINRVKEDPQALNSMLRMLQRAGDSSHNAEIMELQAHAFAQKSDFRAARDLYQKLSELEPENSLHSQNYKQMLSKLGEDPTTRVLSAEEAAQAFMVEELEQGAPTVHQNYDPPTERAIEAALTDAELFVSYNVPAKAIPPLEAVLPLAPHDVTVNQRLATLYARGARYADAARACQVLSEIYRQLGHETESARYLEAARNYNLRVPGAPAIVPAAIVVEPVAVAEPPAVETPEAPQEMPAISAEQPALEVELPVEQPASSVQEFSFDVPDHLFTEPEAALAPPPPPVPAHTDTQPIPVEEMSIEAAEPPELQAEPAPVEAVPAETEIDVSSEWEDMVTVESAGPPPDQPEMEAVAIREDQPAPAESESGGSPPCYAPAEKIQEARFYISQEMWEGAKKAILDLTEIAPDAPEVTELIAAVSAGQSRAAAAAASATAPSVPAASAPPLREPAIMASAAAAQEVTPAEPSASAAQTAEEFVVELESKSAPEEFVIEVESEPAHAQEQQAPTPEPVPEFTLEQATPTPAEAPQPPARPAAARELVTPPSAPVIVPAVTPPTPIVAEEAPLEDILTVPVEIAADDIPAQAPLPPPSVVVPAPVAPPVAVPAPPVESLLEDILDVEPEPLPPVPAAQSVAVPAAPSAVVKERSTEDILTDFVAAMEKSELADFVPRAKPEPVPPAKAQAAPPPAPTADVLPPVPAPVSVEPPPFVVPPPAPAPAVPVVAASVNGDMRDAESASVLSDILSELQEETADGPETKEDPEIHYNLGIAFKEMGLLDEAIGELQKVCHAMDRGSSFSQPIQAYTWLAQCLVDKAAPEAAVRWYKQALQLPGLDDVSRCAIYYDLAMAFEAFGDKKSALANFMEVYGSNIDFRDVASRIKALKS
jgi:tetratricopeptide (TPR) repeat protein